MVWSLQQQSLLCLAGLKNEDERAEQGAERGETRSWRKYRGMF